MDKERKALKNENRIWCYIYIGERERKRVRGREGERKLKICKEREKEIYKETLDQVHVLYHENDDLIDKEESEDEYKLLENELDLIFELIKKKILANDDGLIGAQV